MVDVDCSALYMWTRKQRQLAWSDCSRRGLSVCPSQKTVKPIGMPFRLWTHVGSVNHALNGGSDLVTRKANFVKYRDTLPWAVQKRLNWSRCRLGCGLGCVKESIIRCTLAQPGKYGWTVRVRRRCGLMSSYFDHWYYDVLTGIVVIAMNQVISIPVTHRTAENIIEVITDQPSACFSCHVTIDTNVFAVNVHRVQSTVHVSIGQYVGAVSSNLKHRHVWSTLIM